MKFVSCWSATRDSGRGQRGRGDGCAVERGRPGAGEERSGTLARHAALGVPPHEAKGVAGRRFAERDLGDHGRRTGLSAAASPIAARITQRPHAMLAPSPRPGGGPAWFRCLCPRDEGRGTSRSVRAARAEPLRTFLRQTDPEGLGDLLGLCCSVHPSRVSSPWKGEAGRGWRFDQPANIHPPLAPPFEGGGLVRTTHTPVARCVLPPAACIPPLPHTVWTGGSGQV